MNRLKFLREEKGLIQKDIAEYLHCSIAIISMYEKEQRVMDVNIVQKLSDFFGVSIDYLLGKSDIRNPEKVNVDELDMAFASGIKGLNKQNQETLKNIMEGLIAKQKMEDKNKDK